MCAHLWLGPMGGCAGIPETDFLTPRSLSPSPLPPGSPPSLGTELARLDPWWRSEWSSLRLRRILPCGSLMLLLRQSRLITFWETASSKRCRCFLGMKILANMVACVENKKGAILVFESCLRKKKSRKEDGSRSQIRLDPIWVHNRKPGISAASQTSNRKKVIINSIVPELIFTVQVHSHSNQQASSFRTQIQWKGEKKGFWWTSEKSFPLEVTAVPSEKKRKRSSMWSQREKIFLWGERQWGNLGVARCLLESHCCSVRYQSQNTAREKGVGVSEHGISPLPSPCLSLSLSLSLSLYLQHLILTLLLSYTSVHASPLCHSCQCERRAGSCIHLIDLGPIFPFW